MFALLAAICFAILCFHPTHPDVWFHAGLALWALHFAFMIVLPQPTRPAPPPQ